MGGAPTPKWDPIGFDPQPCGNMRTPPQKKQITRYSGPGTKLVRWGPHESQVIHSDFVLSARRKAEFKQASSKYTNQGKPRSKLYYTTNAFVLYNCGD